MGTMNKLRRRVAKSKGVTLQESPHAPKKDSSKRAAPRRKARKKRYGGSK